MKITGIIEKVDLDGGVWTLKAEDGTSYRLKGGNASLYSHGDKATIFEVKKYKKI